MGKGEAPLIHAYFSGTPPPHCPLPTTPLRVGPRKVVPPGVLQCEPIRTRRIPRLKAASGPRVRQCPAGGPARGWCARAAALPVNSAGLDTAPRRHARTNTPTPLVPTRPAFDNVLADEYVFPWSLPGRFSVLCEVGNRGFTGRYFCMSGDEFW